MCKNISRLIIVFTVMGCKASTPTMNTDHYSQPTNSASSCNQNCIDNYYRCAAENDRYKCAATMQVCVAVCYQ